MKRAIFLSILGALFFAVAAQAQSSERIVSFDVVNAIQPDGSVRVTETIVYDFGTQARHGIYRDIPVKYRTSYGNYTIRLKDIDVTDVDGTPYQKQTSRSGGDTRIRIGDPDALVTGVRTYVITYQVERAILFGDESDRWYWNVTGNGWEVPIGSATAEIILPEPVSELDGHIACYRGLTGSTQTCEGMAVTEEPPLGSGFFKRISFSATVLSRGEGLTVDVWFPKGLVLEPTVAQKVALFVQDNWPAGIPVIALIVMFYFWYTRGRDPRGRGTIIAEYEPPEKLTPAQVGGLVDQHVHAKDISAEIIELAVLGYLKIKYEGKKDYTFVQLKSADEQLNAGQQQLLDGFCNAPQATDTTEGLKQVALKDLKDTFASTLQKVKATFETSLVKQGFYTARPYVIRGGFAALAIVCVFLALVLSALWFIALPSLILTSIIVFAFGWAMPRRTQQGVLAWEKILGFKEYLSVVEAERLKFHNAPEKKPELFERWLPYAMVLGVEKQWADQFKDIYTTPPQWYTSTHPGAFNSVLFAHSMSSFASDAKSVMASHPSSGGSGGGSSGGGFGGGGGGSW